VVCIVVWDISSLCPFARRASYLDCLVPLMLAEVAQPLLVKFPVCVSFTAVSNVVVLRFVGAWWGPGACFMAGCAAVVVPLHMVATVRLRYPLA
jgi:hypothetical protein